MEILSEIADNLLHLREKKPLIHHITNYVTVNDCANMTLAVGASPVMADDIGEVEEMVAFAAALVLNMGTLNLRTVDSMLAAGRKARKAGIPVIFDPVGVGATKLRTETAAAILREVRPSVIRGNMSEIKLLAGLKTDIKGVDSAAAEEDGEIIAAGLSRELDCVVAITGKRDIIAYRNRLCYIDNGHPSLAQVTGTGCMATSLIGCYCGVTDDWFCGAAAGILTMGLAGEVAQRSLRAGEGIGTFRVRLFDAVSTMLPEFILKEGKIHGVQIGN
ncbi:hydroxyethylthiazole kinase [Lucifera butyrica]|uniref:Hydroxyethylthiazole kinase n=1 Tax=Lucifera butyrica TaxID=1351585 RepID=A0A498R7R8_9FIRM|nr:hydroxyethylthiazole kinase [Lucifera butyrica]VBB06970.1 hydroxyethylthiazole kinase [Lucifera butyrica]